ncbi:MAG TPA: aromatic ring-hydroxylating dioxygenase subunit alpha [Gemmatimonadales bacterium]|nr:aromatic ring-hydroxylating dioxygenase subunit alpha [Gemmatimonadales bacterium]
MALERTLPRACYFSPEIFAREKERIFCREWVCVGREEEIPAPGDYLLLELAGESVLVVRTAAGAVRGFYNVCRHRGSRLVLDAPAKPGPLDRPGPSGRFAGAIRCPYHAWTYTLDGALRTAPFLDEGDLVCKADLPLHAVAVEAWGGFLFANLTPGEAAAEGRTLAAQLARVPERLARYPLAQLRTARRIRYEVQANWKVLVENYNECYHCAGVHPELCRIVPQFRVRGGSELDWDRGIPHRDGAWTFTMSGTTDRAPFPGLSEDERTRHKGELIYPNFMLSLSADHAAAFTLWPRGPERTTILCDFLFHPDEIAKASFDPSDAVDFWDLVNRQDWTICEGVQRGMSARVFESGYYAPMESWSLDIRRYLRERLGEDVG